MDTGPIIVVHLIKLINEADSFIGEDECSTLERPLTSDWVSMHAGRKTDGACTFTCRVDDAMVDLFDVLEELTLGCAWVSEQEHINVTTDSVLAVHVLGLTAKHGQCQALLDEIVTVDRRCNRLDHSVCDVSLSRCLSDLSLLLISELNHVLITKAVQVVCLNDCLEDRETVLDVCEVVIPVDVDSVDFNFVARASDINKIMQHEDFFLAGHATGRHRAWCLLNCELLVVAVERFHLVNLVGTALMAHNTLGQTRFCLLRVCVADGSLEIATLAPEVHLVVLWENLRALGDDSAELYQGVQVNLAQLTHLVLDR